MNVNLRSKMISATVGAWALGAMLSPPARADVYWNGSTSSDWSDAANWINGLPSVPGAGNAVINPWGSYPTPVVSFPGNTTVGQVYLAPGGGLNVVGGGQLSIATDLITGNWGSSAPVSVSGGTLNIGGLLNMGVNNNDGDVNISGGTVFASALSINTLGGAGIDLSGSGTFVAPTSELVNITYWVNNDNITANGGAPGWAVNIDTLSQAGNVVLTAVVVPEPGTAVLASLGMALWVMLRRSRA